MKQRISTLLLLALATLPFPAFAQLWIENLTDTTLTFAFRGVDTANVVTTSSQRAGARLSYTFDPTAKTIRVDVTNLSGGTHLVGTGSEAANVTFGSGTFMGFGFETNPDNLTATALSTWANSAFNVTGLLGTDAISFVLAQDYTLNGGSGSPFIMDVGADTSGNANGGNPASGLAAGYGASFLFTFNTAAFDAATFNPFDFFFADNDADLYDMSFRFQQTGTNNGGSDKVAVFFDFEEEVPEPATYGLLGAAALLALVALRRHRR